jgi:membrane fusion protein, heavy metal efflux system
MIKITLNTLLIITTITILSMSCSKNNKDNNSEDKIEDTGISLSASQLKNTAIQQGKLDFREFSSVVKLNGKIDVPPQNMISVSAPLGGYLKATKLLPGMHVTKGEVIATLDDPQYIQIQQDYLLAKSKLHYAEIEYNRQLELNKNQAGSDKAMQTAQAEMNFLKITLNATAEKLKLININPNTLSVDKLSKSIFIYSTISGFVSKVNVNIGKFVNPSDVLFELIDPTDIHLNINVYEKDIKKLTIGQKVVAYTNTNPEVRYNCEIILIGQDLNAEGLTEVHCHFEGSHRTLTPGMYMNAEIQINASKSHAINEDAIVNFENKNYLFIKVKEGSYTMQEANLGLKNNGYIEIKNSENFIDKTIITKGAYTLLMALKNKEEE